MSRVSYWPLNRKTYPSGKEGIAMKRMSLRTLVVVVLLSPLSWAGESFRRADASGNGVLDLSDAVRTLGHLFLGGEAPPCLDAADANDDGGLDLSDAVHTLGYLFLGGAPPPPPFGACGADPTADPLGCGTFAPCGLPPTAAATAAVGPAGATVELSLPAGGPAVVTVDPGVFAASSEVAVEVRDAPAPFLDEVEGVEDHGDGGEGRRLALLQERRRSVPHLDGELT